MIPIVRVDPVTRQLVDEQGNTRFVRGMSVAYKVHRLARAAQLLSERV